ncbi:MAG TPA: ATP-binding protein [Acidimicrobiales bacterium]|jgi:signal transduction histidine kinase
MESSPTGGGLRSAFDGGFEPRVRRAGVLYVAVMLPVVAALGSQLEGHSQHLLGVIIVGSWPFTLPALVVTWRAIRRAPSYARTQWLLWLVGLLLIKIVEIGVAVGTVTSWHWANPAGPVVVVLVGASLIGGLISAIRTRSGRRALTVDLVEWAIAVVSITAPAVLLWWERVVTADTAWFTIPAFMAAVGTFSGLYWCIILFVRLGPERCPIETLAVLLNLLGIADGVVMVAQGLSGFTLPVVPIIALHAACMGLLLLIPLYMPTRHGAGLGRLPLQAQVRGGRLPALSTLAGLPVLLVVSALVHDELSWGDTFTVAVLVLLLVLAALRQLAAVRETRRLYAQVERASEDRRELLASVIQRVDDDRHKVAAQLHEQAIWAYATFVVLFQRPPGPAGEGSRPPALPSAVHDDLRRQAESLRQLMLATQPLVVDRPRSESLAAPIRGYLDSLYGHRSAPELRIEVDGNLVLDWITETLALRIVQEALNNVWRHSHASSVEVELRARGTSLELRIDDDGDGFDPAVTLFESGIAAMRSFAAFGNGSLAVRSAPGAGTSIVARLGEQPQPNADPATPHLRLVQPTPDPTTTPSATQ